MAYLPSVQTVIRHLMDMGPQRCHWKARWCRHATCLNKAEIVLYNYLSTEYAFHAPSKVEQSC